MRKRILWVAGILTALVVLLGALQGLFGALTDLGKAGEKFFAYIFESTSCDRYRIAGEVYLLSCESTEGYTLQAVSKDNELLAAVSHQCNPTPHWRAQFKNGGYAYEVELHSTGVRAKAITYRCTGGSECPTDDWHRLVSLTDFPASSPC